MTLPIKKEIDLSSNEKIVFENINNKEYQRAELENLTGLKKDTLIRILNSLINKGLIIKKGNGTNISYCKKSK